MYDNKFIKLSKAVGVYKPLSRGAHWQLKLYRIICFNKNKKAISTQNDYNYI